MKPLKPEVWNKKRLEIENTSRLMVAWADQLPEFADKMLSLSVASAALIWKIGTPDEQRVRDIMAKMVEAVVASWKAQKQYSEEQDARANRTQDRPGQ